MTLNILREPVTSYIKWIKIQEKAIKASAPEGAAMKMRHRRAPMKFTIPVIPK